MLYMIWFLPMSLWSGFVCHSWSWFFPCDTGLILVHVMAGLFMSMPCLISFCMYHVIPGPVFVYITPRLVLSNVIPGLVLVNVISGLGHVHNTPGLVLVHVIPGLALVNVMSCLVLLLSMSYLVFSCQCHACLLLSHVPCPWLLALPMGYLFLLLSML